MLTGFDRAFKIFLPCVKPGYMGCSWEKAFCVTMLFGFALGMALGEAQHARAFQVICGLGVILSYAAEGVAFAGNAQEVTCHE